MLGLAMPLLAPVLVGQVLLEGPCVSVTGGWCAATVTCTAETNDTTAYSRIRQIPGMGPVETGDVHEVQEVCHNHSLELPSVHSDLDNWCLFHAGLHGTKGRVPVGLVVAEDGTWAWIDGSKKDYSRFNSHVPNQPCARVDQTLAWTSWPCDTSANHDQLDYIVCSAPVPPTGSPTQSPTGSPSQAPTQAPSRSPSQAPTQAPSRSPTNPPTDLPTAAVKDEAVAPVSSSTTETKEANTHLYWAVPTVIVAMVAAFVAWWKRSHVKKTEGPRGIGISLHAETQDFPAPEPKVSYTPYVYNAAGSGEGEGAGLLARESEPEYSLAAEDDTISTHSTDSGGYLKPQPLYSTVDKLGEPESPAAEYDIAEGTPVFDDEEEAEAEYDLARDVDKTGTLTGSGDEDFNI